MRQTHLLSAAHAARATLAVAVAPFLLPQLLLLHALAQPVLAAARIKIGER